MKGKWLVVVLAIVATLSAASYADAWGYHYRPYRYRYFYRPYGYYGYWPYAYRPYWYGAYGYPYPYYVGPSYSYWHGAVRTQVKPRATQVYVDGYYAGTVDDFDGTFQRLYLRPGKHDLELRLEGHRTFRESVLATSGETIKIHHEMEKLGPGEMDSPPPVQARTPEPREMEEVVPRPREERPREQAPREERPVTRSRFGTLALRVQPVDTEVWIDGERWGRLEGIEEIVIHLPEGRHHVSVRKDGYAAFEQEVVIEGSGSVPLNVRLSR